MKKLKKLALWLMMLVLVFSLSACGEKEDDDSKRDREDRVEERDDDEDDEDDKSKDEDDEDDKSKDEEDEPEATEEPQPTEEPADEMISAKDLIMEITEASQGQPMTSCTYILGMDFGINMEGFSMDMAMSSKGDMLLSTNPYTAYTEMVMKMTLFGQETVEITKSYMIEEDGEVVTYTSVGEDGQWVRESMGTSVDEMLQQNVMSYEWLANKPAEEFVVDSELHNINGKEAYKVEFTLTGEEMQEMMDNMGGMEGLMEETGVEGIDYTMIDVPAVYYVDTTTHQVVQMDLNIEGMGELMTQVMEESLSQDPSMAGYQVEVTIGDFVMSYTNISYDPVEMPEIPTEILSMEGQEDPSIGSEEDIDWGTTEPQKKGGTYIIEESGVKAEITCSEDWTITYDDYDTLDIENEETWQEAEFVMYVDVTREDFVSYVEDMVVPELEQYNLYISHGAGPEMGAYETMEVLGDGLNFYFAWTQVGEGWIMVMVSEFNGVSLEEALPPILDMVNLNNVL